MNKIILFLSNLVRKSFLLISRFMEYSRVAALRTKGSIDSTVKISSCAEIYNCQNYKSKLSIRKNTRLDGILQVFPFGNGIQIGENCYIGQNSRIWAANNIIIGDNVLISHNVNIIDTDSHEINYLLRQKSSINQLQNGLPKEAGQVMTAPIIIKDNAWISYNACILKGVTIGKGAIVGCGAVVTKDVPDFSLAVGNPARVIKSLI